jgi:hypothetical protein
MQNYNRPSTLSAYLNYPVAPQYSDGISSSQPSSNNTPLTIINRKSSPYLYNPPRSQSKAAQFCEMCHLHFTEKPLKASNYESRGYTPTQST